MYAIFEMLSNSEAKNVINLNFAIKEMKDRTIISHKQNIENKAFWMHLIKIKEIQTENKTH